MGGVKKSFFYILGSLFLAAVPLWSFFVSPHFTQLPENFSLEADIISVDAFYNSSLGEYDAGIFSQTRYAYETIDTQGRYATIEHVFDVRTPEGNPIFAVSRQYGIDRITGQHVQGFGDKGRNGYLFAPPGIKAGEPFVYWHINYDAPASMQYVGEEMMDGLRVFRYVSRYSDVRVDQTEELGNLPGVGETRGVELEPYLQIWIEPTTGRLVQYQDDTFAYFYDLATGERLDPWNHFSNRFQEASVKRLVEEARFAKILNRTVSIYIPAIFLFLALMSIIRARQCCENMVEKYGRYVFIFLACIPGAVAIAALLGWVSQGYQMIQWIPEGSGMNPLTALLFLTLSMGVIARRFKKNHVAVLCGTFLIVAAGLRLANIFGLFSLQVDLLLFGNSILSIDFPARVSEFTAIAFFLSGIVLAFGARFSTQRIQIPEIISSLILIASLIAVSAYLFEARTILDMPLFASLGFNTAILFVLTSALFYAACNGENRFSQVKNWLMVSMVLFIAVAVFVLVTVLVDRNFTAEDEAKFTREVDQMVDQLSDRIDIYVNALEAGVGLFAASEAVERDEWRSYVEALQIQRNYPGIQGMGYAVFVTPEEKEAHEASLREEGFPEYQIKPPGERDVYSTIVYLEPFDERNRQAFGFDMYQEKTRRAAMARARDTGFPQLSGRVTLVQEIDEDVQAGFLIYIPFYRSDLTPQTLEARRQTVEGFVYSPFRATNFVEGAIADSTDRGVHLAIYDGFEEEKDGLLYGNLMPEAERPPRFTDIRTLYLAGRPWILRFESTPEYGRTQFSQGVRLGVLGVGIIISILIAALFYTLLSSREQAMTYAERLNADLRKVQAKTQAMLFSIGDGLIATDQDGRIVLVNHAFTELLGWTEQEVQGKLVTELLEVINEKGEKRELSKRYVTQALQEKRVVESRGDAVSYVRKDGQPVPVEITVAPIILEGEVVGSVEVFKDVTNERSVDKAKTEFVSLASHQLRTPLSAVNWYTESLANGDLGKVSKNQKAYLDKIRISNKRMIDLVNSLLNVSRIELGTFAIQAQKVKMHEILREVVDELKPVAKKTGVKLVTRIPKRFAQVNADPKLLRMIFQNVLSNAVKYTPKGGTVHCRLSTSGKNIRFEVTDTGYGIPEKQQSKIFTKLFRADNVTAKQVEGTGLGLYIVKSIVDHSGGKISFQSVENEGTTFTVLFPKSGMKAKKGTKSLNT